MNTTSFTMQHIEDLEAHARAIVARQRDLSAMMANPYLCEDCFLQLVCKMQSACDELHIINHEQDLLFARIGQVSGLHTLAYIASLYQSESEELDAWLGEPASTRLGIASDALSQIAMCEYMAHEQDYSTAYLVDPIANNIECATELPPVHRLIELVINIYGAILFYCLLLGHGLHDVTAQTLEDFHN